MNSLSLLLAGVFGKRTAHIWTIRTLQPCLFAASGVAAFLLRYDFALPEQMLGALRTGVCVWVIAKTAAFHWLGLDRGMWRYFATPDLMRLAEANAIGSAAASAALLASSPQPFPRSVLVIDFLISPNFFSIRVVEGRLFGSVIDVFYRAVPTAMVALGMAVVIGTKGIDLSVGSIIAIGGAVTPGDCFHRSIYGKGAQQTDRV